MCFLEGLSRRDTKSNLEDWRWGGQICDNGVNTPASDLRRGCANQCRLFAATISLPLYITCVLPCIVQFPYVDFVDNGNSCFQEKIQGGKDQ